MKTGINLLMAYLLLVSTGCSQTGKIEKGYAYSRNIISGVKPKVSLEENGTITTKSKGSGIQYFIYLEMRDTSLIKIKNIWIGDHEYWAEPEAVKNLPVIIPRGSYASANNDTLVAAGTYALWKINVVELIPPSNTRSAKPKELTEQGVVIGYLFKGKMKYYSIPKIKNLEPARLQ